MLSPTCNVGRELPAQFARPAVLLVLPRKGTQARETLPGLAGILHFAAFSVPNSGSAARAMGICGTHPFRSRKLARRGGSQPPCPITGDIFHAGRGMSPKHRHAAARLFVGCRHAVSVGGLSMKTRFCTAIAWAGTLVAGAGWFATGAAFGQNDNWHGPILQVSADEYSGASGTAYASDADQPSGGAAAADPSWIVREPGTLRADNSRRADCRRWTSRRKTIGTPRRFLHLTKRWTKPPSRRSRISRTTEAMTTTEVMAVALPAVGIATSAIITAPTAATIVATIAAIGGAVNARENISIASRCIAATKSRGGCSIAAACSRTTSGLYGWMDGGIMGNGWAARRVISTDR